MCGALIRKVGFSSFPVSLLFYSLSLSLSVRPDVPGVTVKEVIVATTHFVILTDDGRIYRIPYSLASESSKDKRWVWSPREWEWPIFRSL